MKIVAISDTHEMHRKFKIPKCDLLVHAGDLTWAGSVRAMVDFHEWIAELKDDGTIQDAIVIGGNHDLTLASRQRNSEIVRAFREFHYLQDASFTYKGIKFWGHPWTPVFGNWGFMLDPARMRDKILRMPNDIDVLISHGPPYGVMDLVPRGELVGCPELLEWVKAHKDTLKLHIFGHIHEGYGVKHEPNIRTLFVNAASVDGDYKPVNAPIEIELNDEGRVTSWQSWASALTVPEICRHTRPLEASGPCPQCGRMPHARRSQGG